MGACGLDEDNKKDNRMMSEKVLNHPGHLKVERFPHKQVQLPQMNLNA